jgi:hypothetical protein
VHRLELDLLPGSFAVCRLGPDEPSPRWAVGVLGSVTRTADELSVICPEEAVPEEIRHRGGWRCLAVRGPLAFEETGVLAALAGPLAEAGVPLFALSTFDTDYLLVPGDRLEKASSALRAAGHRLRP